MISSAALHPPVQTRSVAAQQDAPLRGVAAQQRALTRGVAVHQHALTRDVAAQQHALLGDVAAQQRALTRHVAARQHAQTRDEAACQHALIRDMAAQQNALARDVAAQQHALIRVVAAHQHALLRGLATLIFCAAAMLAHPHLAAAADLSEVYAFAKRNDALIQSAGDALAAAKERAPEAVAALLPSVSATATGGYVSGNTWYTGSLPVARGYAASDWNITLTQPLLRLDNIAAYRGAQAFVRQAVANYQAAEQDLILRVAKGYFALVVAQKNIEAARSQLGYLNEQRDAAQKSFDKGSAIITDVEDSQSRASLAEAQLGAVLNEYNTRLAELEAISGPFDDAVLALRDGASLPTPSPDDLTHWTTEAEESNPLVLAAEEALSRAAAEVARIRAQRLPAIDLLASYDNAAAAGNIDNPVNYASRIHDKSIGIQVTVPLTDGGRRRAQIAESEANERKAAADVIVARRQAALDARVNYQAINNGLAQIQALDRALSAARSALNGNQLGYRLGIRINSDVLNAQLQLYSSERDLEKVRYDTLLAGLRLKASVGGLTVADVASVNKLLLRDVR